MPAVASSNPLASTMRRSPNSIASPTSRRVRPPTSTSPGRAACCSRAPMFTSAPITMLRSLDVPTATCPVFTPDPHADRHRQLEPGPDAPGPLHDREAGSHPALGVVVVQHGHAEHARAPRRR